MVRERRHEYKSRECVNVGVRIVKKQRLEERQVVVVGGVGMQVGYSITV